MTVAVGVVTGAGVTIGRMLALGVDLLPAIGEGLLGVAATGVGLMLAVGGSDVLALLIDEMSKDNIEHHWNERCILLNFSSKWSITFPCQ